MPNHLANETSPHLRQHANDPIDWYPWGDEAWARAVGEAKPVFLSIGYASDHGCHVMHRESFADPDVAALLNAHFISIKVDREERPDLDGLYLESLVTLMGVAGWPMNLFLTPDKAVFFGGTYYPPKPSDEMPSFKQVVDSVADEWDYHRRELEGQAAELLRQMRLRAEAPTDEQPLSAELLNQGIAGVVSSADLSYGGFGEAPKFPQPWLVELMLRAAARGPGGAHGIADRTLRRMARGGIYDQVGGGFHRYAVDGAWVVPHFEKMLYDNALMARLYTHAWQARHDPLFHRVATEPLDYLVARLRADGGGFFSAEDSDDAEGREGAYWRWSYDEFMAVAPDAAGFFGVTPEGNFEGDNVLTAAGDEPPAEARARLAKARDRRTRPAVDTKIISGWNGLVIAALADAGAAFGRADYRSAAEEAATALLAAVSEDGSVAHALSPDGAAGGNGETGIAEDYAYVADGLFALWEATFEPRWLEACERVARRMIARFWDAERGGLYSTPEPEPGVQAPIFRRKDMIDGVTPSPNGVASLLLQRLGVLLGDEDLRDHGRAILQAARAGIQAVPQESASLLAALDFLVSGSREIVIAGEQGPAMDALLDEIYPRYLPNRVLAGGKIASPLLENRGAIDGRPTAYVCEHSSCRRPTSDPAELARQLRNAGLPSPEQLSRAADMGRSMLHRMSLFDELDNPLWIDPLREQGFFRTPPGSIEDYVPGASGSPPWPDSKYLAKMAGVDPFAVHRVAMAIPDTDNPLVHEDLADAALALPPDLAADFARRASGWLTVSVNNAGLPKKLGSLLSHLAKAGHGAEALELAGTLLELHAQPGPFRGAALEEGLLPAPQPEPRFGSWDLDEILKQNMPDVVRAVQLQAFELLASVLEQALELSREGIETSGPPWDGSYLWRPNIGDDPRNLDRTVRNSLVSALRDAGELIARENPGVLGDLVASLDARGWAIFRRISLHLLWVFRQDSPQLVAAALSDRKLLEDPHTAREYLLLAHQLFDAMDEPARAQLLGWLQEGPDLARWDGVPERWAADQADEQAAATYSRWWVASRSAFLQEAGEVGAPGVPAAAKAGAEVVAGFPGPDDSNVDGGSNDDAFAFLPAGPPVDLSTPKQADWLRAAPIADIVGFAQRFRPPPFLGAPTASGFRRKVIEVVTSEPSRFAEAAGKFAALGDDDLRAVIAGWREASRQATAFPWGPVVGLFTTLASRWSSSKPAPELPIGIARCLAAGLTTGSSEIPAELRTEVWDVIRLLAEWPPEAAAEPGVVPVSVAAEGLQAVTRYALWVRRQLESTQGARVAGQAGFDLIPEVREVLERHLATDGSPITVQAVFGQWFPWLLMLDPQWAVAHSAQIFSGETFDDGSGTPRQAAWDSYLARTPVFDQVFELLSPEYQAAIGALGPEAGLTRPQQGLAEHLMSLYLRGRVTLDGLFGAFLERAPETQRAHALAYIGQMMRNQEEGRVPGEILARLQRLWEQRLAAAKASGDPEAYAEELSMFGHWFASGKFETAWALRQLAELLQLTGRVTATSKVVEGLKPHMESMPLEVVQCIAALVSRERGEITILGWGQDAQQILSRIVGSSHAEARNIALDLLDTFDLQPVRELVRWS